MSFELLTIRLKIKLIIVLTVCVSNSTLVTLLVIKLLKVGKCSNANNEHACYTQHFEISSAVYVNIWVKYQQNLGLETIRHSIKLTTLLR